MSEHSDGPRDLDVVVIGGGIAGAAAAWSLASELAVALVEMEPTAGVHATGRSAAMLNQTSGPPVICALAGASRAFLADPPDGFGRPLLGPRGLLWVGAEGTGDALADLVAKSPATASALDPAAARRLVPGLLPAAVAGGAVHEPSAMTIDVAALLAGYLRGLRARGGLVGLKAEAVTCTRAGDRWMVEAGPYRLGCRVVVNAAGAWADVVAARAGIQPLGFEPRRRTAALAVAPDKVTSWPMVMDVEGRWYAEPETGGLLISPSDETPWAPGDVRPDEADVALALERVNQALGLKLRSVRRAWAGLRTFSPDRIPVAGPDRAEPSFVWLAGQGGSGIKTAPALARVVHDLVVHGTPVPPDLAPDRFAPRRSGNG